MGRIDVKCKNCNFKTRLIIGWIPGGGIIDRYGCTLCKKVYYKPLAKKPRIPYEKSCNHKLIDYKKEESEYLEYVKDKFGDDRTNPQIPKQKYTCPNCGKKEMVIVRIPMID